FGLRLFEGHREITIEKQIVQCGIETIRLHDAVQKYRANDAAASPDRGDVTQIKVPLVFSTSGAQKLHSLRVRHNFRRVKRVAHCIDETRAIAFKLSNSRLRQK